jgi:hypothetical protein
MLRTQGPVVGRRLGWVAAGLVVALLWAAPAQAQQTQRLFNADAGLWLHFVKPESTADFEEVIAKLREALEKSEKPERKQQAASWKIFKQTPAPSSGNVLYVFFLDPAVRDVDYTISTILSETLPPAEVAELFKKYADAYGSPAMNVVDLQLLQNLGQ